MKVEVNIEMLVEQQRGRSFVDRNERQIYFTG